MTSPLFPRIHRALRAHQQRHRIPDLLDGEHLVRAEARHGGAGERGMRVVYLLVRRLRGIGLEVAQLAVFRKARAERAVAHLGLGELVAGVTVAAIWLPRRIIREAHAVA